MSKITDDASQPETQSSSDAELHETISSSGSTGSPSSSEPLIESYKRTKGPHSDLSDAENQSDAGPSKRAKWNYPRRFWWKHYAQELNETICDITREDPASDPLTHELQIGASLWAPDERETLYQALSRYGRRDCRQLSKRVQSKSALEIDVFLQVLERGSNELITYQPRSCHRMMDIPAAVEVEPDLDRSLEQSADAIALLQSADEVQDQLERYGDIWLLDGNTLGLVTSNEFDLSSFIPASDPIASDVSAALGLFNLREFLQLSCNIFMNSREPEQNYTTYAESREWPSIRLTAAVDFYRIVKSLTARLFITANHCALTRIRERSTHTKPEIVKSDVLAALEILSQSNRHLRNKGTEYWIGMLRRCNVQPTARTKNRGETNHVSIDSAEWWLRRRFQPLEEKQRKLDASVSRADLEKACATDLVEENHLERKKARTINDLYNDYEPFTSDHADSNDSALSGDEIGRMLKEESDDEYYDPRDDKEAEKDEARAMQEDAIAASKEAKRLRPLCREPPPGNSDEELDEPRLPKRHRRHPNVRLDWSASLEYKAEWERYRTPIALQIVERDLPKDASPDAVESASEPDATSDLELLAPGVEEQAQQKDPVSYADQAPVTVQEAVESGQSKLKHAEGDIDTSMEDGNQIDSPDAPDSVPSSADSSSEVSTSSEE